MKKVLFHSLTIPPDNVSTGMLVAEIADGFKGLGVDVEILASSPQYNVEKSLNSSKTKFYSSTYKNINITNIISSNRSFSKVTRFFQWIKFHYQSIKFINKNKNKYSHVFIFSYPPTMNLVVIYIRKFLKIKVTYSYWELYPEIANNTFKSNSGIFFNIFKKIDSYAMKLTDNLVVNSPELKTYLLNNRGLTNKDIRSIYHFSPYETSIENPKNNYNAILYAGNMGKPQNLENFINVFNSIDEENWNLELYGRGQEFEKIKKLENDQINVYKYLPRDELYAKTKEIPIALISLDKEITIEGFPGKTFDYLSMNKVLLCFANADSAVSKFIEKYELGICIEPNNQLSMKNALKQFNDKSQFMNYQKNVNNLNENILNKAKVVHEYFELI